jgi:integrase
MTYEKRAGGPRWSKVVEVSGASRLCSTGTRDRTTADAIERWHQDIRQRGDTRGVLRAIVDGRITLAEAYSLDVAGTVQRLAEDASGATVDVIAAHLPAYLAELEKKRRAPKTRRQIKQQIADLYPHGVTTDALVPTTIAAQLAALGLTAPTQNRYRAALSGFCRYLVKVGVLLTNPVRDVETMPESARELWHTPTQLFAALAKCDPRTAAIVALMAGGGFEWCAIAKLTKERVNLTTLEAHAEGGKSKWRNRHVKLRLWVRAYVAPVLKTATPGPRLFITDRKRVFEKWVEACQAAEVPVLRLHDNRHTHAVHLLQDGESYKAVAHQLGHKNEKLVIETYGVHAIAQQHYRVLGHEAPAARRPRKTTKAATAASSTTLSPASRRGSSSATHTEDDPHAA